MSASEVPRGLPISIAIEGDSLIVRLSGEIDIANVDALPSTLAAAVAESDAKVVVDIADVEFVDSSFLRAILLCRQNLGDGVAFSVRNAREQARRVFEITNLLDLLD